MVAMNVHLRIAAGLALAALVVGFSACERAAPPPTRVERPQPPVDDSQLVTHESGAGESRRITATLRDEAVRPASMEDVVPAPKTEQQLAADALTRIGPPAVPMLVKALASDDLPARRQACEVLMRMGPDAKEAVPALVHLLEEDDEELRRMAAVALGRIGPDAGQAVPNLMRRMLQGESAAP